MGAWKQGKAVIREEGRSVPRESVRREEGRLERERVGDSMRREAGESREDGENRKQGEAMRRETRKDI